MDGQPMSTTNIDILFDKRIYSSWRERMKGYFKTKEPVIWETTAWKPTISRNEEKLG